jgi:hypothetical protein
MARGGGIGGDVVDLFASFFIILEGWLGGPRPIRGQRLRNKARRGRSDPARLSAPHIEQAEDQQQDQDRGQVLYPQ